MKCPVCKDKDLMMSDRQGIEIDYCPNCRGVWLDRGELDKIIEKSAKESEPKYANNRSENDYKKYDKPYLNDDYAYKKKKNMWSELFDF